MSKDMEAQKPIKEKDGNSFVWICPICGNHIRRNKNSKCPFCRTPIDWKRK